MPLHDHFRYWWAHTLYERVFGTTFSVHLHFSKLFFRAFERSFIAPVLSHVDCLSDFNLGASIHAVFFIYAAFYNLISMNRLISSLETLAKSQPVGEVVSAAALCNLKLCDNRGMKYLLPYSSLAIGQVSDARCTSPHIIYSRPAYVPLIQFGHSLDQDINDSLLFHTGLDHMHHMYTSN